MNSIPKIDYYVLNGGSLLHRSSWKKDDLYNALAESHAEFTVDTTDKRQWCLMAMVKALHKRQHTLETGKNLHPIVSFTVETQFSGKREDILSHDKNKADMIDLNSTTLTKRECHVIREPGDADIDIAKTTVERSLHCTTTLVGEDIYVLI